MGSNFGCVYYYAESIILLVRKVFFIINRPGGRIDEWVSRMDEFLSEKTSNHG